MVDDIIFGDDKVRLLNLIECGKIKFVTEPKELNKFECVNCHKLALYNYTAACKHIYCGKCHGQTFGKSCCAKECKEKINEAMLNEQLDREIANLNAFCPFQSAGCSEKIVLHKYLSHTRKCPKNFRKLLPKVYQEDALTTYKEITDEEIRKLKEENRNLQERLVIVEKQLLEMRQGKDLKEEVTKLTERLEKKLQPITENLSSDLEKQKKEIQSVKSEFRRAIDDKIADLIERQAIKWNKQEQIIEKMETNQKGIAKEQEGQIMKTNNQKEIIEKLKIDLQKEMAKVQEKFIRSEEKILQIIDKKITNQTKIVEVEETAATEFQWTISGIGQILKDWGSGNLREIFSDSFTTKALGYKLQCKLMYHANQKAFSIMIKCDRNSPKSSAAIFLHQRTVSILDQTGENNIVRIDTPGFGNTQVREWMSEFHNSSWPIEVGLISKKYIKNDAIVAKILIQPLAIIYKSIVSKNGKLTWKLTDYRKRTQEYLDGVTKCLRSPYFYTSERGYRVHIGLHIRSWDVSFYLSFNKGEFDDWLPSTFPHKASLILIAQSGRKYDENLTHVQTSTDTSSDLIAMIPTEQLESKKFLKDDCILVEVTVESQYEGLSLRESKGDVKREG